jgi:hypothetical protein
MRQRRQYQSIEKMNNGVIDKAENGFSIHTYGLAAFMEEKSFNWQHTSLGGPSTWDYKPIKHLVQNGGAQIMLQLGSLFSEAH